jgi:MFS family permease
VASRQDRHDAIVRRNLAANVFDGTFFAFSMSFVATTTILPVLVKKISTSNVLIGLLPVLWTVGFNFPQMLVVSYVQRLAYKKPWLLKTALAQRIPWLLLAMACFFVFGQVGNNWAVLTFFLLFAAAAVCGSLNLPGWFDLIAKITPVQLRGRLFALRSTAGAILGILGGYMARYFLDHFVFPVNFAVLFLAAFCMMMFSYGALLCLREEEPSAGTDTVPPLLISLKLWLRKPAFRAFLYADALMFIAITAEVFYTVQALHKFALSDGYAGTFVMIMMGSMITCNFFFGYLADHYGHRMNLTLAAAAAVISCSLAFFSSRLWLYLFVFAFSAMTTSLLNISRLSFIAEIAGEQERPTIIALANMLTSPFILLGVFAGLLADKWGYQSVFLFAGGAGLASALVYVFFVPEPRPAPVPAAGDHG